jgi:hypothetical protein
MALHPALIAPLLASIQLRVGTDKPLIASLGHLGRRDEAKPYIAKLLSLEPNFTVERFGQVYPLKKTSDRRRYMRGLRLAGVPER